MTAGGRRKLPKKRERTQIQLIEAAVRVFAEKGVSGAPIQAIAAEAGLANGTFYNHFPSKNELTVAVAAHLVDRFSDKITASVAHLDDPAEWVSAAVRHFNEKARQDPVWGSVTVSLGAGVGDASERITANMTRDIEEGIRRGRFKVPSRQAAADTVLGTGLIGILSASTGRAGPEHAADIASIVLRGLGLDPAEADEIAHRPLPPLPED